MTLLYAEIEVLQLNDADDLKLCLNISEQNPMKIIHLDQNRITTFKT